MSEIHACHPWLDAELEAVRPELAVALGATAAFALAGNAVKVTRDRGKFLPHPSAGHLFATLHPSVLLRIPDPEQRHLEYGRFVDDLKLVSLWLKRRR